MRRASLGLSGLHKHTPYGAIERVVVLLKQVGILAVVSLILTQPHSFLKNARFCFGLVCPSFGLLFVGLGGICSCISSEITLLVLITCTTPLRFTSHHLCGCLCGGLRYCAGGFDGVARASFGTWFRPESGCRGPLHIVLLTHLHFIAQVNALVACLRFSLRLPRFTRQSALLTIPARIGLIALRLSSVACAARYQQLRCVGCVGLRVDTAATLCHC